MPIQTQGLQAILAAYRSGQARIDERRRFEFDQEALKQEQMVEQQRYDAEAKERAETSSLNKRKFEFEVQQRELENTARDLEEDIEAKDRYATRLEEGKQTYIDTAQVTQWLRDQGTLNLGEDTILLPAGRDESGMVTSPGQVLDRGAIYEEQLERKMEEKGREEDLKMAYEDLRRIREFYSSGGYSDKMALDLKNDLIRQGAAYEFDKKIIGIQSDADYMDQQNTLLSRADVLAFQGALDEDGNPIDVTMGMTLQDVNGLIPAMQISQADQDVLMEANLVESLTFQIKDGFANLSDGELEYLRSKYGLRGTVAGWTGRILRAFPGGSTLEGERIERDIGELFVRMKELANFGAALTETEKPLLEAFTLKNLTQATPQGAQAMLEGLEEMTKRVRVELHSAILQGSQFRSTVPFEGTQTPQNGAVDEDGFPQ